MKRILLVPSTKKGNGSGHLVRCFSLARELGAQAEIFLPENPGPGERGATELALSYPAQFERSAVRCSLSSDARYDLVVLDRRSTELSELERWAVLGPVLCLDEGGPARQCAEYLVDILPGLGRVGARLQPNVAERAFLDLPKHRREAPERLRSVLVSFGGEDPGGLTGRFVEAALKSGLFQPGAISVVRGPLHAKADGFKPGIVELGQVQDLKERLASYDLVVCSFGLTAYEAAWAGCAVLLYNPSAEHDRLSRAAGFPLLPMGRIDPARLKSLCARPELLVGKARACAPADVKSLSSYLAGLEPTHAGSCPACGKRAGRVVARYERKTYLRCPDCGLVRMAYFVPREHGYTSDAYFFDEYKAQYGKTYIEDLPNLRAMAARRLGIIEGILAGRGRGLSGGAKPGRTVLDVGCAYGAFVAEAQSRQWHAIGSDVSEHAVDYVKTTVGAPAFVADFSSREGSGFYPRELDCLCMWYVIEHFDRLGAVLDRASSLLKEGGVFAFSTPSASGVSARLRPGSFWERSPDDHYTALAPGSVRGILARYGFRVQKLRITGHHPERFPWVPAGKRGLRWRLAMVLSRALGLGDTFECYAIKTRAAGGRPKAVS